MDNRDFPSEKLLIGGWTKREIVARDVALGLLATAKRPNSLKLEDIDRWAEGLAICAVTLTDTLFDYLGAPERVTPARVRREVREGGE